MHVIPEKENKLVWTEHNIGQLSYRAIDVLKKTSLAEIFYNCQAELFGVIP